MKATFYLIKTALFFLALASCESDDAIVQQPFVVAFEKTSHDFSAIQDQKELKLVFSEKAQSNGTVTLKLTPENAQYGVDFSTIPLAFNQNITIPFTAGQREVTFTFTNLIYPFTTSDKAILFEVVAIDYPSQTNIQGYTTSLVSFERSLGATLQPEIGGPNQGDQVYVDLSTETVTKIRRDSWDLGFYGGDDFRVCINGSVYMAVKELAATNIDAVTAASVQQYQTQVGVGTFDPTNVNYVDAPNGHIDETAIAGISSVAAENKVYLVNLGYEVGTTMPPAGSVAIAGNQRGWRKVRILKEGGNYLLQYAELGSTTHQEIIIPKDAAYNFTFFSFNTQNIVPVEPEKTKWDLNFTVFTNEVDGAGSYGFSDFVVNNLKAGVKCYQVNTTDFTYEGFALANVIESSFVDDQRVIGADWRDVFTGTAFIDRFYILKDLDGNYYKIKMLAFLDDGGVRGYPQFEYKLLQ